MPFRTWAARSACCLLAVMSPLSLQGCFEGGGTETGNAGLAGLSGNVVDGGGTETGNSHVFLVSVKYPPAGPESSTVRSVKADARGRFEFRDVAPGGYALAIPGSGETPLTAIRTRLTLAEAEQKSVELTVRPSVTLTGRVLPESAQALGPVRICVPGLQACVESQADSTYRLPDMPAGAYELVFLTPQHAHYLSIQVSPAAAGTVYLRDLRLASAADADHVPYRFYEVGRAASFSSLPVRYADNAGPAWYAGKDFGQVEYFLLSQAGSKTAWNPDYFQAWKYRRAFAGDSLAAGPDLAAPLAGFPVALRLHAANFDFSQAKGDGSDLAVSDGQGRFLSHQVERWDSAAGRAEVWIRLESLAAAKAARTATLHWGGGAASGAPGPVFRRSDGFIGAWHLSERGGDSLVQEALSRYPGRLRGAVPAGGHAVLRGDGMVAGGYRFGSTRNYVNVGPDSGLDVTGAMTVAVWARLNPLDSSVKQILASKWAVNKREWHFHIHPSRSLEIEFGDNLGQIQGAWRSVAPLANLDQWHHYAATFEGGLVRLYVDGQEVAGVLAPDVPGFKSGSIPKTVTRFQSALNLGSNTIDHALDLDGDMDEFWYGPEAKSADWIRMAYETQRPR